MPRKPPYIVFTQPLPTKGQYKVYSVATSESLGMIKGDNSKRYWEAFDNDGKFLQSAERKKQLMDFFREIDKKRRQLYTKIHIYTILYKSCSFKQIIYNNYATNLKTTISQRSLRISGLLLL
mgnify:CR=1 FL=1